jgi:hypothetical protein
MKWYDSSKHKPIHGSQIFIWDVKIQKKIYLNAFWDEESWTFDPMFPVWSYVFENLEPIKFRN